MGVVQSQHLSEESETDLRLQELHHRLVAWWFGSFMDGSELRSVWDDAFRRYDSRLRALLDEHPDDDEQVLDSDADMLFQCFEQSLSDHDNILVNFPTQFPAGWEEWLQLPPGE